MKNLFIEMYCKIMDIISEDPGEPIFTKKNIEEKLKRVRAGEIVQISSEPIKLSWWKRIKRILKL